jgi:hypothetical protein
MTAILRRFDSAHEGLLRVFGRHFCRKRLEKEVLLQPLRTVCDWENETVDAKPNTPRPFPNALTVNLLVNRNGRWQTKRGRSLEHDRRLIAQIAWCKQHSFWRSSGINIAHVRHVHRRHSMDASREGT